MKISLEWLNSFTPDSLDEQAVADALTHGGLNVDAVEGKGIDAVLEVEVTSNRGDCLSHAGVARELAALTRKPFEDIHPAAREDGPDAALSVQVAIESAACPHYTTCLIRGVKIGPSPDWMAARLAACGIRPINNVVDVTNYVLLEMGQPLHAFDFSHVDGGKIIVRQAAAGETLVTLDGHKQTLAPWMLVIADRIRPLALAGIMGGEASQVTGATVDILLESARFDPLSVRRTSRALGLRSESSYRFERGIATTLPARASLRAAQLILETAGGTLSRGMVSAGDEGYRAKTLILRLERLAKLLGVIIPPEEVAGALHRLHLAPKLQGEEIVVHVPSWRLDLNIEADLIEEVIRVLGYDRLPLRDEIAIRLQRPEASTAALEMIRQTLVAAGFYEAVTFSFVSDALKDDFFPAGSHALRADASVRKADATLRPSLLPGLLEAVRRNEANGTADAMLFEIGSAFGATDAGAPDERRKLALVGGGDWRDLRGVVECVLGKLDAGKSVKFIAGERAGFAPGACGRVEWNGKPIGFAGRIDRAVADKLSLRHPPMACELDLAEILAGAAPGGRPKPLAQFPAARRDLSLVVDDGLPYERIEQTLSGAGLENLEEIDYVTTFRGKALEAGKKSVSVALVFRSETGTLTGEQVEAAVVKAVAAAGEKIGATLRS